MQVTKALSTVLFTATVAIAAALVYKPAAHSSTITADAGLQTVTVSAHRMSAEEKAAFDREEAALQSVVVTAQRMSNEEKAAFDRANAL